jgi:hypothetical protein
MGRFLATLRHGCFDCFGGAERRRGPYDTPVGDADETQPGLEIGDLEIVCGQRTAGPDVEGARRQNDRRAARRHSHHVSSLAQAKGQSGVSKHVDIMFQAIRYSEVPHRRGEQPRIEPEKMRAPALKLRPCLGLFWLNRISLQEMIAALDRGAVQFRQVGIPQVESLDRHHDVPCLQPRQEMRSDIAGA